MQSRLFLSNWADVLGENQEQDFLDYESLLASDDEFLILTSLMDGEELSDEY